MFPAQTIIVPVDFSPCALAALYYAVAVAEPQGGSIHLIHVVNPAATGLAASEALSSEVAECFRDRLAALSEPLVSRGLRVSPHTLVGQIDDEILTAAHRYGADLIVMGTHGRAGWGHVALGSIAERIVRRAECPVLTVKDRRMLDRLDLEVSADEVSN